MRNRFVCAVNRGRDGYQVPLALYEAGLLERLVTDFYAPEASPHWLPSALRRRRTEGLPTVVTRNAWASFALQSVAQAAGAPMANVFKHSDRLLARTAARVARMAGAHLYCYQAYLPEERAIAPGTRRVVFAFHPQPGLSLALLAADHARWPQVAHSFAAERRTLGHTVVHDAWRRADAIVCASSMTQASLVHDGCPPERITVVPYGLTAHASCTSTDRADRVEFLFVGQGVQRKGLHHLVAAWQAAALPSARLTLACQSIDSGIRAMISSPSIRLLGRRTREELDTLYAAADVFVMPSIVEGFGLVYGEALAHGCHLIGTANTGLADLSLPPQAATLVAVGDIDALTASLARWHGEAIAGRLDRAAIRAASLRWQWRDFRNGIRLHAAGVLA